MAKKKRTSKFRGKVAQSAKKQVAQGSQYGYLNLPKGVNIWKEEPKSKVKIDILPYLVTDPKHPDPDATVGEPWYCRPYKVHRGIGPNNDSIVCPTSIGQKCPICEYRAQRLKDGADSQDDEIKALKPSRRNLYVVVPLNVDGYEKKPHIWDISQFLFQDMLNEEILEDEDYEIFPDLEEGLTLQLRFSEETFMKNKFAKINRIDFIEREEQYGEDYIKNVPNLDEILQIKSYEEVYAFFFEVPVESEEEEDEEEEKPKRKKKSFSSMREDEEFMKEEEEEEGDDDEDDEDDIEEEEEDDIEEEEEEEEEKPKRPKKTKAKKETGTKKKSAKKSKDDKCPYGHRFGVDTDEFDDCDDCDLWEECIDEKEGD